MDPILFIVMDGLPDTPKDGKTPLSVAKKPNMDYLAKNGICGELITVPESSWTGLMQRSVSHFANLRLLGYEAENLKVRRGVLEALGSDIPFENGELAIRCDMACVDENLIVLDRRAQRNILGLDELVKTINEEVDVGVEFILKRNYGHRAVLIFRENLSDEITDSDPFSTGWKVKRVIAKSREAERSAEIVQEFLEKSHEIMEKHEVNELRKKNGLLPVNYLLTREAGNKIPKVESFLDRYGIFPVCIAENGVMKGTCKLVGFDTVTVPELSLDETLDFIFDTLLDLAGKYDFVYTHIKATDEPAHDGDFKRKVKVIEEIDKRLEPFKNFRGTIVITSDHITSSTFREHMKGPVPILIYGKEKDDVDRFDEFSVKKGRIGKLDAINLMEFLLKGSEVEWKLKT